MLGASVIVSTHDRARLLEKSLRAILQQDFEEGYEVIVVNDGSTDNTQEILNSFSREEKIRTVDLKKACGPAYARNRGIEVAGYPVIVIMDDDCIPAKDWLKKIVAGFSEGVGMVSSFSLYGGTSTAFLKKAIDEAGYFDEEFPFEYREDTDLVFRVMEKGYKTKFVDAEFQHLHEMPNSLMSKLKYLLRRTWVHQVDPLLYKKHPELTRDFLNIKHGFLVSPRDDFNRASGEWKGKFDASGEWKGKLELASPQGVVFLRDDTPFHKAVILIGALVYLVSVKLVRLYGSIKHGKLLV